MNDNVIKVNGLWKRYEIHPIHTLWGKGMRLLRRLRGSSGGQEPFWALRDINFEVKRGEALGIIGPNGAGKSTLLKILCGVTNPTRGGIEINGRAAPLIELGAGFHPELSGRENVFINGVIMGMSLREIRKKYDSIVEFSGLSDFMDTPVKRYSSGMFVRLGFSVAIHTEPDILLVDEVLAVGDINFRAKCFEAIRSMLRNEVTLLLVSHNPNQIQRLCSNVIYMNKGEIAARGEASKTIATYQRMRQNGSPEPISESGIKTSGRRGTQECFVESIELCGADGAPKQRFATLEPFTIRMKIRSTKRMERPLIRVDVYTAEDFQACCWMRRHGEAESKWEKNGLYIVECHVPQLQLMPGRYRMEIVLKSDELADHLPSAANVNVIPGTADVDEFADDRGVFYSNCNWKFKKE